jgi:hypothetical protein
VPPSSFRKLLLPLVLIACVFVSSPALAQTGQPNIVIILASFINRHATEQFFLGLSYNALHVPKDTRSQSYLDRVANITDPQGRVYAAMITALDDGIGQVALVRILDRLLSLVPPWPAIR